jgi:hypothetical protein
MKNALWAVCVLAMISLAWAGMAIGQSSVPEDSSPTTYLAEEDTFSFSADEFDTLKVSAARVSVEEIIQAIGERIEADDSKIETNEYTVLTTMIARENSDPDCGDFTIYESAVRHRVERGSSTQSVQLWERERTFKDGELDKEELEDEEFQTEWNQIGEGIAIAVPFDPSTGHKYRYELDDRRLVGNNVVYKILFEPKSQFDALPEGTVWVDYSDLVIRRFEARYTNAVPMPLFLKAIPFVRVTAKKLGDFWVADEIHARAVLRNLPLPDWPADVEIRVVMKDQVINGVAFNNDGTLKDTSGEGSAP